MERVAGSNRTNASMVDVLVCLRFAKDRTLSTRPKKLVILCTSKLCASWRADISIRVVLVRPASMSHTAYTRRCIRLLGARGMSSSSRLVWLAMEIRARSVGVFCRLLWSCCDFWIGRFFFFFSTLGRFFAEGTVVCVDRGMLFLSRAFKNESVYWTQVCRKLYTLGKTKILIPFPRKPTGP